MYSQFINNVSRKNQCLLYPKSLSNTPALEETKLPFLECCLFGDIIEKERILGPCSFHAAASLLLATRWSPRRTQWQREREPWAREQESLSTGFYKQQANSLVYSLVKKFTSRPISFLKKLFPDQAYLTIPSYRAIFGPQINHFHSLINVSFLL